MITSLNKPTDQTTRGTLKFNIEITGVGTRVLFLSQDLAVSNATPSATTPNNQFAYSRQWLKRTEEYGAFTRISVVPTGDYGTKQEYSSNMSSFESNTNIDFKNPRGYYIVAETSTMFGVGSKFMLVTRRFA